MLTNQTLAQTVEIEFVTFLFKKVDVRVGVIVINFRRNSAHNSTTPKGLFFFPISALKRNTKRGIALNNV